MTNYIRLYFSLLLIALSGCAATVEKWPPITATIATIEQMDAEAAFASGMRFALNGNMKAALPHFSKASVRDLNAKKQAALARVLTAFDMREQKIARSDIDSWTAHVLGAYQHYWTRVMLGEVTAEAGERELAETLAALVGVTVKGGDAFAMAELEPKLQEQLRTKGYYSLLGVTSPLRDLMLWRTQLDQVYEVKLPHGHEMVSVAMLGDFVSLGWLGFSTGDYYHTGGWATRESLYCVRMAYDLESESFRISYLAHEGQHFADYKRFPNLEGPELEYRAKLVELAYADTTTTMLLKTFGEQTSANRELPHSYANRRLMNDLAGTLNIANPIGAWWASIPHTIIRTAALRLFNEDTQRLEREGTR